MDRRDNRRVIATERREWTEEEFDKVDDRLNETTIFEEYP